MKSIAVKGEGVVTCSPSNIIVYFEVTKEHSIYEEGVNLVTSSISNIIEAFKVLDIKKDRFITSDFKIETVNFKDEYKNSTSIVNYRISHTIILNIIPLEVNINKVIEVLVKSGHNPNISIEFKVNDYDKYKEEALSNAIVDGKRKGAVIIKSLGVKSVNIVSVKYDGELLNDRVDVYRDGKYFINNAINEIHIREQVTIVFEF